MNTLCEKFEQLMKLLEVAVIEYKLNKLPTETVLAMSNEQQLEYFRQMAKLKAKMEQLAFAADAYKNAIQESLFAKQLLVVDLTGNGNQF